MTRIHVSADEDFIVLRVERSTLVPTERIVGKVSDILYHASGLGDVIQREELE